MSSGVVHSALVDVMLLVGVDDNTSLIPSSKDNTEIELHHLIRREFEAHVISAISATDMVNFCPFPYRVQSYPPDPKKESVEAAGEERMLYQRDRMLSTSPSMLHSISPSRSSRSKSLNPKVYSRHMSIRRPTNAKTQMSTIPVLPISDEVIGSISSFCFPEGFRIIPAEHENERSTNRPCLKAPCHYDAPHLIDIDPVPTTTPAPHLHAFVLTNIDAGHTYAHCLTFYRQGCITKDDQGNIYISLETEPGTSSEEEGKIVCYFPHCCVLISKYPYYNTLKECLSSMLMYIERDPEEMTTFMKDYAVVLTHTPVPPPGNVAINFKLYELPLMLLPSVHAEKAVVDLPLHLTLLCFDVDVFLRILECILAEERVVFLAQDFALLTTVMETMMTLILPLKWRFTYSTVLPTGLLTLLESPGTFMYGVHASHKRQVQQVEGLVLVDIDEGTVTINPDSYLHNNGRDRVPHLPKMAVKIFKRKWSTLTQRTELSDIKRPYCFNIQDLRDYQHRRTRDQNDVITHASLELMVNLFRDVLSNLNIEHRAFNKAEFLEEHEEDRVWYEMIFKTDMFKIFLEERMLEKSDYWLDLVMKTGGSAIPAMKKVSSKRRMSIFADTQEVPREVRKLSLLCLPEFTDQVSYMKACVEQLTNVLEVSEDFDEKTSLHYILALFMVARGNKMAAIDNLIQVAKMNDKIFPTKLLMELYTSMNETEKSLLNKKAHHQLLLNVIEGEEMVRSGHMDHGMKIRMDPVTIPDKDLDLADVEMVLSEKGMSNDYTMIAALFKFLHKPESAMVDAMTFQIFVACWDDNQMKCNKVVIPDRTLGEDEVILKISSLVKTDFGLGRVCLTDKRLFFLHDVSNLYKEIVKLRKIRALEQSEHVSFLTKVPTLQIFQEDSEKAFTIHLKDERNWWYVVVKEMWAGKVVAEAMKDVMMVQNAIQNTLLIDAIVASGQDECSTHYNSVNKVTDVLCFFSNQMEAGKHILPRATTEALQRKIDPNMTERERKTVQCLLYTGGDESLSPRLWVGLSTGKIKVYNAITWNLEKELEQTKPTVMCLKSVGGCNVWVGASGIYIFDSHTITFKKTLLDHKDLVVDIVVMPDRKHAYSASLDGMIIKWNVEKHSLQKKSRLDNIKSVRAMKLYKDKLVCSTWSSIILCDLEGVELKRLSIKRDINSMPFELDGFIVTTGGQIWAGGRREGLVYIWDLDTGAETSLSVPECKGISCMAQIDGKVWMGTKDGDIKIYRLEGDVWCPWKQLKAHDDAVRVLSDVRDRYIVSGASSKDGRVCIWSATNNTTDSGNFALDSDQVGQH